MQSGRILRRKKTNLAPALAGAITMYAPGNFPVPYGANAVRIGGRGPSGNYGTGGNYASGGNAYTNPTIRAGYSYTVYYDTTFFGTATSVGDRPWGPKTGPKPPQQYYSVNPGAPGNSVVNYTTDYTEPGYTDYNPTYYNPYFPGSSASATNIGGVTFPGGAADSIAPAVTPTVSTFKYQTTGISITVPPGGFVTLTPIG